MKDVIVIIGPQMSGKTTLIEALKPHFDGAIFDSDDWDTTADDIGDAQAYAADKEAIIITAQTTAQGVQKLEQLDLKAEWAKFFYLESRHNGWAKCQK
jgi:predicted ATP-dependent endonuclease of OLD family